MQETVGQTPLPVAGTGAPSAILRKARKSVKYALARLLRGRLEYVLFYWRLQVMRVKTLLGRPYAALYGMDRKLEHYIGFKGGTFIEAGANDASRAFDDALYSPEIAMPALAGNNHDCHWQWCVMRFELAQRCFAVCAINVEGKKS